MALKSDRWIYERASLQNYCAQLIGPNDALLETISLKDLLESETVSIADIAAIAQNRSTVYFEHSGKLKDLQLFLQHGFQREVIGLNFRFSTGANMPAQPQDFMAPPVPMIYPFCDRADSVINYRDQSGKGPSYGLSSYGYDIRLGNKFRIIDGRKRPGIQMPMLDFLQREGVESEEHLFKGLEVDCLELLPNAFALGVSLEYMNIPNNMLGICMQKSSVARKGCIAFVTPLEPGWRGYITLELFNATEVPMRIYAGMGIMQLLFVEGDERCMTSYSDRAGKYMEQPASPVLSRMG
jgi:dCTP deaminase